MRLKPFLAALLALAPLPAFAQDVTAHYLVGGKTAVTVEVDDGGNSRIEAPGQFAIVRRDAVDYVVVYEAGEAKVFELDAMVTLFKGFLPKPPQGEVPEVAFDLHAGAEASVGGRPGMIWKIGMTEGPEESKDRAVELVMSADPALVPVGDVFRRTIDRGIALFAVMIPESAGLSDRVTEAFAKGTPLRITAVDSAAGAAKPAETLIEFQSLDTAEIDPKHFDLPAPVTSAEELMGLLGSIGGSEEAASPIEDLP